MSISPQNRPFLSRPFFSWRRDWIVIIGVVIALLAMLPGLCFVGVAPKSAVTKGGMFSLADRIGHVIRRDGKMPDDLSAMPTNPGHQADDLVDAWDRPIRVRQLADGTVELLSLGRDGKPGGTGEEADIRGVFDPAKTDVDSWLVWPSQPPAMTTKP